MVSVNPRLLTIAFLLAILSFGSRADAGFVSSSIDESGVSIAASDNRSGTQQSDADTSIRLLELLSLDSGVIQPPIGAEGFGGTSSSQDRTSGFGGHFVVFDDQCVIMPEVSSAVPDDVAQLRSPPLVFGLFRPPRDLS
jgi:hypothetical protein